MGTGGLGLPSADDAFIDGARRQLDALQHVTRLLALDDLWTGYLEQANTRPQDAVAFEGLQNLAAEMEAGIRVAADEIPNLLRPALDAVDDGAIRDAIGLILEAEPSSEGVLSWVLNQGTTGGDPRATLTDVCDYIEAEVHEEVSILQGKVGLLRQGVIPDPDMRPLFRCAITVGGVGLGIAFVAAGVVTAVGVVPTILGGVGLYGYSLFDQWEKSKCGELWNKGGSTKKAVERTPVR